MVNDPRTSTGLGPIPTVNWKENVLPPRSDLRTVSLAGEALVSRRESGAIGVGTGAGNGFAGASRAYGAGILVATMSAYLSDANPGGLDRAGVAGCGSSAREIWLYSRSVRLASSRPTIDTLYVALNRASTATALTYWLTASR